MAVFVNPKGIFVATDGDDTLIFDTPPNESIVIDALDGHDDLVIHVDWGAGATFDAWDLYNTGVLYGNAGSFANPAAGGIIIYNAESVDYVGTAFNDTFDLKLGSNTAGLSVSMDGGAGQDLLKFNGSLLTTGLSFFVSGGSITSSFGSFANFETFEIHSGSGNDNITTGGGDDQIYSGSGVDNVNTGSGNDQVFGASTGGNFNGGSGTDYFFDNLSAYTQDLTVTFANTITTSSGIAASNFESATVHAGSGNDHITVLSTTSDAIYGEAGRDILSYQVAQSGPLQVSLSGDGTQFWGTAGGIYMEQVEFAYLPGGDFDDHFYITQTYAHDAFFLDGGAGNDLFEGDFWWFNSAAKFVVAADGTIDCNRTQLTNFETFKIIGSPYGDTVITGAGADYVETRDGDDFLSGGAGNDLLAGGKGSDILIGGLGSDTLAGNEDADRFYFNDLASIDRITDFSGPDDKIYLDSSVFLGLAPGQLSAGAFGLGPATTASQRILWTGSNEVGTIQLFYDPDGNGPLQAQKFADVHFSGGGTISAANFVVYSGTPGPIQSSVDYTLAAGEQDLMLTGNAPVTGNGNELDNVITGNDAGNILNGLAGSDGLIGAGGEDYLFGGDGDDRLHGGDGADHLYGDAGNDFLEGEDANDWIEGGDGNDILDGGAGPDILIGGDGDDVFHTGSGGEFGGDTVVDGAGNDTAYGGPDQDLFEGGAGNDYYDGAGGSDWLYYNHTEVLAGIIVDLRLATGQIRSSGSGDPADIGVDTIVSVEHITGSGFDDVMWAGTQGVFFGGNDGNDTLNGNVGNDEFDGGGGNDKLYGNGGADSLTGNDGDDYLFGNDGNDSLSGDAGYDRMYGGTGDDTYYVNDATDFAYENAGEGHDLVISSVDVTLRANVEDLTLTGAAYIGKGNAIDNLVTGTDLANKLYGYEGNDTLNGMGGDDYLFGADGNDILTGGAGYDRMYGGIGDDTYYVNDTTDYAYENLGEGNDKVISSLASYQLRANVEELDLAEGSTVVRGYGQDLDNVIIGNSYNDFLYGRGGNDIIKGGGGADLLYGESGNDMLEGGAGMDRFYGGTGADTFLFRDGDFAGMTSGTADRIHDFSQAEGDQLDFSNVDANTLTGGDQAFSFIGNAAFGHHAGELRYYQQSGVTYVAGDTNGDGVADFTVRIDALHTLQASDFIL